MRAMRACAAVLLTACLAGAGPAEVRGDHGAGAEGIPGTPQDIRPLLIGSRAPGGVWPDAAGADFDLGAALDARPTILVFYRAHW